MSLFATLVPSAILVKLLPCLLFTTRCQNIAMVITITTIIETHVALQANKCSCHSQNIALLMSFRYITLIWAYILHSRWFYKLHLSLTVGSLDIFLTCIGLQWYFSNLNFNFTLGDCIYKQCSISSLIERILPRRPSLFLTPTINSIKGATE